MDTPDPHGTGNIPENGRFCPPFPPVPAEGEQLPKYPSKEKRSEAGNMRRRLVFQALLAGLLSALTIPFLGCGGVGAYAQQDPAMTYSGSNVATTIDLGAGNTAVTDEELFAGDGALGPFTYRELHADEPSSSSTCTSGPYYQIAIGAGVFRFGDGSLLTVNMTEGDICVDLSTGLGHLTETYQITGGTGRFSSASGTLTLTGTLKAALFALPGPPNGAPKLLTNTGEFQGTILGMSGQ